MAIFYSSSLPIIYPFHIFDTMCMYFFIVYVIDKEHSV